MFLLLLLQLIYFDCHLLAYEYLFAIFSDICYSYLIAIALFKIVSRMSYQLPLTAKIFYLLTLSNPMFKCYAYIFAMVTTAMDKILEKNSRFHVK